jgi:hypothetical protein
MLFILYIFALTYIKVNFNTRNKQKHNLEFLELIINKYHSNESKI